MDIVMLTKLKRLPTKSENDTAAKIVDEARKKGVKIETFRTYGQYDIVSVVKGSDSEEDYLRYLYTVKAWADVQTLHIIDDKLGDKMTKKFVK